MASSVSVTATATDANSGDTLTYSASSLPTGLSINSSTGAITGTPSAAGSYSMTVTVSDGTATDSESFTWTITANNVPVLSPIGAQGGTRKGHYHLAALSFGRTYRVEGIDITASLDGSMQNVRLDAYRETGGTAAYHFFEHRMQNRFLGGTIRFEDENETPDGLLAYFAEFGFMADFTDSSTQRAYFLSETSTLYLYDYKLDFNTTAHSMAHSRLSLGTSLRRKKGLSFNGMLDINRYKTGSLMNLSVMATKQF